MAVNRILYFSLVSSSLSLQVSLALGVGGKLLSVFASLRLASLCIAHRSPYLGVTRGPCETRVLTCINVRRKVTRLCSRFGQGMNKATFLHVLFEKIETRLR